MIPYYDDGTCVIYHADCRETLHALKDTDADLVFADPPYNVGIEYGEATNDRMTDNQYLAWNLQWYGPARNAAACVAITPGMVSVPMWIKDIERTHKLIAWTKANNNSHNYFGPTSGYQCWEPILVYGKSRQTLLRDWIDQPISLQSEVGGHPCPKPLRLMRWIVQNLSTEGGLVIDPFMGSGTTLRAAKDLGRRAIGIEIEERYCEIAARRLAQEVLDFGTLNQGAGLCEPSGSESRS